MTEHVIQDEENLDPQILQSPQKSVNKLKRKSRLIRNRRLTEDQDENEAEENVEISMDESAENLTREVLTKKQINLKRRATKSMANFKPREESMDDASKTSDNGTGDEDSLQNKLEEREKVKKVLKRGARECVAPKLLARNDNVSE